MALVRFRYSLADTPVGEPTITPRPNGPPSARAEEEASKAPHNASTGSSRLIIFGMHRDVTPGDKGLVGFRDAVPPPHDLSRRRGRLRAREGGLLHHHRAQAGRGGE